MARFPSPVSTSTSFATLLAVAVLASPARAALSVSKVSEVTRPSSTLAEQISGITWAGGDLYYAVDDNDSKLYPLTLSIDHATGTLNQSGISIGEGVAMSGVQDMEGCAFDPCSGNVWISDEGHYKNYTPLPFIREFNPTTGEALRKAPLNPIQYDRYGNFSFEALTISGDGLSMWTANEEALKCDGTNSTQTAGSTVRLTRYVRPSLGADWVLAGEWAYLTQPVGSAPVVWNNDVKSRSGVAGLCALPDGTLLVLERNLHGGSVLSANFYTKIYKVDFSGATDISGLPGLTGASYVRVQKSLLYNLDNVWVNYEGICLGPRLDDGSCALVLVADGGSCTCKVMTLKLSGLNVRTMHYTNGAGGEPAGGPYRYVNGTSVTATLPGAGSPYETDLRVHAAWAAPANNASGEGSTATLTVTADDTLTWSVVTNATLPLLAADSFERLAPDTEADALAGWSGDAWVADGTPARPAPAGYPLERETHERVLVVDGETTRDLSGVAGTAAVLDTMIRAQLPTADAPVADADGALALHFDLAGHPTLQHLSADGASRLRTTLTTRSFANGDWVRTSLVLAAGRNGATWCQVRIDGEPCVTGAGVRSPDDPVSPGPWHRTLNGASAISSLSFLGFGAVDDVALYEADGTPEFADASSTTNGVPYAWLTGQGLPWNPSGDFDGDGFNARTEYLVGTDPKDWESGDDFRIVEAGFGEDGRYEVRFLGRADRARFRVVASDDLSAPEEEWEEALGTVGAAGAGTNLWIQAEAPAEGEDARFYRVRATLPETTATLP